MSRQKYPALKVISVIYRIVGYVGIGVSVVLFLVAVAAAEEEVGVPAALAVGLGVLLLAITLAITLIAYGEVITLLIDVEHNTRSSQKPAAAEAAGQG